MVVDHVTRIDALVNKFHLLSSPVDATAHDLPEHCYTVKSNDPELEKNQARRQNVFDSIGHVLTLRAMSDHGPCTPQ
jgi:hypothetical protein